MTAVVKFAVGSWLRHNLQVVSLRNKDRFKEEEVGVVTVPLQDVVASDPQYFRCRSTGKVHSHQIKPRERSRHSIIPAVQVPGTRYYVT